MKVEIEVTCRETIKPCSPTPDHLRHYQLSFLDQISPPVFMPLVLFYPQDSNDKHGSMEKSSHLKQSLSEALTQYYPLAGRVVDNLHVDCNDDGVPYVEARVNCQLSEFISDPIPGELNKFLPFELEDIRDLPMAIQVNSFDCGGMAVSIAISHKVADALSFVVFMNSWAATARGDRDFPSPKFESASLFPPVALAGFRPSTGVIKENIVTKRFVFTSSKIASLRDKYTDNNTTGYPKRPTRIEALSAFLWSRFMASTQARKDPNRIYTLLHSVNLRTRIDPPLADYYFGNINRFAIAVPSMDNEAECHGIVNQVRDAVKKVDADYVAKLRDGEQHLNFLKERAEKVTKGEVVSFACTSLCRFPLYEADFGWGKPIWVGSASMTFKNLVTFMDTQSCDGIEAWVHLKSEDMAKFEVDKELLAFVLPSKDAKTSGF